jgi:signal peptidase I
LEPVKRAFAALVSTFIPGLGQLGLGRGKRAAVFLSASVIMFFVLWVVPLPEKFAGLILAKLIGGFIGIAAAIDALLLPWKGFSGKNAALLLAIIPVAFWGGTLSASIANLHHGFRAFTVTNTAMEPTLRLRERFVTGFPKNSVGRGDVIAFRHHGVLTMKRVIGVAGDTLTGDRNNVFLNGEVLQEAYVQHTGGPSLDLSHFGPVTVLPSTLFVLGDNRDVSYDSRFRAFGLISTGEVIGKVLYIYYSPRAGRIGQEIH